ncbi:hypothetical protein ASZ78_006357 [Callipepla squamata]|uniref:Bactericidal permeability-increasing protein n=1 Tax=Callipepla squamata TaxID=9009 RepID=A0A226MUW7_CALSU|nr:hypothetical protein ASZ78_006357 [Callipepla squamata]
MWYSFLPCLLFLQLEANPGLKVRITQKGLDYGRKIGIELLKQRLLKESFPSWSGQESFSIVKVNYTISRFKVDAVDIPETFASFIAGTGVGLSVAHASVTISADWRVEAWLLSKDQGGFTLSISELFIAIVFKVSRDSAGHLSVLLHNCQLSIGSVKIKLNEGSSWIYSFLSGYLEKAIHSKLDKNICLNIKYRIQMMDAQLRKQKVLSQIDAFAQIDYSLVSSPAVFKSHINLDLKGTVYPVGNHTDPPFVPAPFGLPNKGDSMLYLGVSNYLLNSATLAYYRAGVFNIAITKDSIVAPLGIILGQGNAKFKRGLSRMKDSIFFNRIWPFSRKPSFLSSYNDLIYFICLQLTTTFNLTTAILKDFVPETASTRANLRVIKQKLIISLLLKRLQISLLRSAVGFSQVTLVENFLAYTLRTVVIPVINDKLGKGFLLPSLAHTTLVRPVIKMYQGHLVIFTDVHYKHEQGEDEDLHSQP